MGNAIIGQPSTKLLNLNMVEKGGGKGDNTHVGGKGTKADAKGRKGEAGKGKEHAKGKGKEGLKGKGNLRERT